MFTIVKLILIIACLFIKYSILLHKCCLLFLSGKIFFFSLTHHVFKSFERGKIEWHAVQKFIDTADAI